jgi:hypothetical protein
VDRPAGRAGEAVDTVPLSEIEPWLKHLTVVHDPKSFPYVIGWRRPPAHRQRPARLRARHGRREAGELVQVARPMNLYAMNPPKDGYRTGGASPLGRRGEMLSRSWTFGTGPTATNRTTPGARSSATR